MRWSLIILMCACAASATWMNVNRNGHKLQQSDDFDDDDDFGPVSEFDWSDEDFSDSDDEDMFQHTQKRKPYHPHHKHQQHKGHHQMDDSDEDDEDFHFDLPQQRQHKIPLKRNQQQKRNQACPFAQKKRKPASYEEEEFQFEEEEEEYGHYQQQRNQRQQQQKQQQQRRQNMQSYQDEEEEQREECKPNYEAMRNLAQVNAQLAAKLHKEAKEVNDDKNTVVSPVALQLVLATLKHGAKGATKTQIGQVIGAGTTRKQDQNAHVALAKTLKGQGPDQTGSRSAAIKSSANVIFRQQSAQEQFVHSIKDCFDADVKRCDFKKQPHHCRDQINKWLMGKQDQKLQSTLAHNSITSNTEMISIGTMQVKANWGKQFRRSLKTGQGKFHPLGDNKPETVKVIQTEGEFNHFEDDQMQVLAVHTQEKQLTLYIILPKEHHGLNKLEKQRLQYGKQLQELMQRADTTKQTLKVQLPVFQIVHKVETKHMLRKMGTVNAFDLDDADFTGISDEQQQEHVLKYGQRQTGGLEDVSSRKTFTKKQKTPLHLNKLIEQATIQINENGIDVASSQFQQQIRQKKQEGTESGDEGKQHEGQANQFQVDHAFAFLVKHNPTNQLLLIGRVVDPTEQYEEDKQGQHEMVEE